MRQGLGMTKAVLHLVVTTIHLENKKEMQLGSVAIAVPKTDV